MSKSKILTIFDLSRTLLIAEKMGKQQYFDKRMELEKIKPNDKYEQYSIYWRNGREELLEFFLTQKTDLFDIAVWSSQDRDKTAAFARSFFGKHYRNLLFISTTNREQYEGPQKEFSPEPIAIKRDLGQINQKFNQYDLHNIIVVSTIPNLSEQHTFNDLIIPKFSPGNVEILEEQSLSATIKYINGISILLNKNKIQDVRTALRSKSLKNMENRVQNSRQQYKEYL